MRADQPVVERILVPLDGSETAHRILTQASRLLCAPGTEVLLARVLPNQPGAPPPRLLQEQALAELATARHELSVRGATRVRLRLLAGDPADELLRLTRASDPSLVCLSFNGQTGLRGTRGRVAEALLRGSAIPLFVTNPFDYERSETLHINRVLVPFDGTDASATVLPIAATIARSFGAELILLHVVELPGQKAPTTPLTLDPREERALLEGIRMRFALAGVGLRVVLGSASEAILELARNKEVGLLAMATHGAPRGATSPFGSVSGAVIPHCPCPLLFMRTAAYAPPPAGAPHVLSAVD